MIIFYTERYVWKCLFEIYPNKMGNTFQWHISLPNIYYFYVNNDYKLTQQRQPYQSIIYSQYFLLQISKFQQAIYTEWVIANRTLAYLS